MDKKELIEKVRNELKNYISLLIWAGDYASPEDKECGLRHTKTIEKYIEELGKED